MRAGMSYMATHHDLWIDILLLSANKTRTAQQGVVCVWEGTLYYDIRRLCIARDLKPNITLTNRSNWGGVGGYNVMYTVYSSVCRNSNVVMIRKHKIFVKLSAKVIGSNADAEIKAGQCDHVSIFTKIKVEILLDTNQPTSRLMWKRFHYNSFSAWVSHPRPLEIRYHNRGKNNK